MCAVLTGSVHFPRGGGDAPAFLPPPRVVLHHFFAFWWRFAFRLTLQKALFYAVMTLNDG